MVGPQDTFLPSSVKQNCVGCGGSTGGAGGGGAGGGDTADVLEGRQRMATIISMVASMRLESIRSLTVQGCRVPLLLAAASNSCAGMPKAGGLDLERGRKEAARTAQRYARVHQAGVAPTATPVLVPGTDLV